MADEDVLARLRQVVSDYLYDRFLMRRMEADAKAAILVGKVEESGLLTARAPFQFGDGETMETSDGNQWVSAEHARRWIDLAQDGERKFREARERALIACRRVRDREGPSGMINASQIMHLLSLTWPDGLYTAEGPVDVPPAPNLQPEAAGNWQPIPDDFHLPTRKPVADGGPDVDALKQQHAETYGVPVDKVSARGIDDVFEPAAVSMQQRRNVRISEQALRAVLGLDEADHVRSVTAYQEPLAVYVQVISPEWEPIPYDSEAPILTFVPDAPAFLPCVAGNEHGECVLADGHETRQTSTCADSVEQTEHVDRWGKTWNVAAGDGS